VSLLLSRVGRVGSLPYWQFLDRYKCKQMKVLVSDSLVKIGQKRFITSDPDGRNSNKILMIFFASIFILAIF